eukprot:5147186-Amphidinium_carterae.1
MAHARASSSFAASSAGFCGLADSPCCAARGLFLSTCDLDLCKGLDVYSRRWCQRRHRSSSRKSEH